MKFYLVYKDGQYVRDGYGLIVCDSLDHAARKARYFRFPTGSYEIHTFIKES